MTLDHSDALKNLGTSNEAPDRHASHLTQDQSR